MNRFRRAIRDRLEKFLDRFYEGPEPPARIDDQIAAYRMLHPEPTHEEWARFARILAENAYRDGYVRGVEWTERDLESKPADDPDVIAEQMRHAWAPSDNEDVRALLRGDAARRAPPAPSDEHFARLFHQRGIETGAYGIVVDEPKRK